MTSAEIVRLLLETNLAAGAAILAVIALRRPARRLIGAGPAYALWLAVPIAAAAALAPSPWKRVTEGATVMMAPSFESAVPAPDPAATQIDPSALIIGFWVLGALAMLFVFAVAQRRFAAGSGPAVVGALRPRIVTPHDFESRYGPDEREIILAHERAHLTAGHAQTNALIALAQCLCWFNPLVHVAARLMRIDQELTCDAAVLSRHPDKKRLYAEALLKTQTAARPLPFGCYWPAGGAGPLKERILMMKRPSPTLIGRLAGGTAAAALVLAGGLTAWAAQPPRVEVQAPQSQPDPQEQTAGALVTPDGDGEDAALVKGEVSLSNAVPESERPSQPEPPSRPRVIIRPDWVRQPQPQDLAGIYPLLLSGETGRARLDCTVTANGTLEDCNVPVAEPAGRGIEEALLNLSQSYQMAPATADGAPVEGAQIRMPFLFSPIEEAGPVSFDANRADFDARAQVSTLSGDVSITADGQTLVGDQAVMDNTARRMTVIGSGG